MPGKDPIIHIPHPTLRKKVARVKQVDQDIIEHIKRLSYTLMTTRNPRGVGLAAPQINEEYRIFTTLLDNTIRVFINPEIIKKSSTLTLGPNPDDPDLEGCLSIPNLYGPVPRHQWVEFAFSTIEEGKLIDHVERFDDFAARVMQHERDHLDGILFLDYSLEYDLPVFEGRDQLQQVAPELIATLVEKTRKPSL